MTTEENMLDDTTFDSTRKKKSKKKIARDVLTEIVATSVPTENVAENQTTGDDDFTYEFLVERIFEMLGGGGGGGEYEPEPPQVICLPPIRVARIGTRRTSFINFEEICNALQRQEKTVYNYFVVELGTTASIDSNHSLIIRGRFSVTNIEKVVRSFTRQYVICKTCRSPHTALKKIDRLLVLICKNCHSQYTVPSIRAGFQAQIGRR